MSCFGCCVAAEAVARKTCHPMPVRSTYLELYHIAPRVAGCIKGWSRLPAPTASTPPSVSSAAPATPSANDCVVTSPASRRSWANSVTDLSVVPTGFSLAWEGQIVRLRRKPASALSNSIVSSSCSTAITPSLRPWSDRLGLALIRPRQTPKSLLGQTRSLGHYVPDFPNMAFSKADFFEIQHALNNLV